MIEWYKKVVFQNYANFSGRARRSEYWYYTLATVIIFLLALIVFVTIGSFSDNALAGFGTAYIFFILYVLATVIPSIAVTVRRLHDIDKSGWFYFVSCIPVVGGIWLLVLMCTEGTPGENQYGSDPKNNEIDEINEIGTIEA